MLDAISKLVILCLQHPHGSVYYFLQVLAYISPHMQVFPHHHYILSLFYFLLSTFLHLPFIYLCTLSPGVHTQTHAPPLQGPASISFSQKKPGRPQDFSRLIYLILKNITDTSNPSSMGREEKSRVEERSSGLVCQECMLHQTLEGDPIIVNNNRPQT